MRVNHNNGGMAWGFPAGSQSCGNAEVRQEPAEMRCGLVAEKLRRSFLHSQIA